MKVCPKCQNKYTDVTLSYCLQDGETLDEIIDDKTLVMDADALASQKTITDNAISSSSADSQTDESPAQQTAKNRSAETVVNSKQTTPSSAAVYPAAPSQGTGKFVAGILIGVLLIGLLGAGLYAAWHFTSEPVETTVASKTRVLSNTEEVKVTASSVREPDKGNTYSPRMAFDGNSRTAWCEGVKGAGRKQWIVFDFDKEFLLKEILIQPGYFKTNDIWRKNNRVAELVVEFSDKTTRTFNFPDEMTEQKLDVGGVKTKSVFMAIKDIYPGASDSVDTLISEVKFVVE